MFFYCEKEQNGCDDDANEDDDMPNNDGDAKDGKLDDTKTDHNTKSDANRMGHKPNDDTMAKTCIPNLCMKLYKISHHNNMDQ